MYTIHKNGVVIATVDAQDVKMDLTGDNPVVVFVRGDKEFRLEQNPGECSPYVDWDHPHRHKHEHSGTQQIKKDHTRQRNKK